MEINENETANIVIKTAEIKQEKVPLPPPPKQASTLKKKATFKKKKAAAEESTTTPRATAASKKADPKQAKQISSIIKTFDGTEMSVLLRQVEQELMSRVETTLTNVANKGQ